MGKIGIIETINHPLGFFALALLIVETFLATVLLGSNLNDDQKFLGMWAGLALFLILIIAVCVFVWFKPKNLTFGEESHLKDKGTFGTESNPIKEDLINKGAKASSGD